MKTIDFLLKVKHIRPTTEKLYNSIREELNDKLDMVEYKTNIDYLINNSIGEVRGEGDQESVFIPLSVTEESSEESGEKLISETNMQREIQIAQKKDGNTEIRLGNVGILNKRLISNLKSEINFLKNQLLAKDTFFQDEITFLCRQLSEALAKKVDTSAYLSSGTIAVNADEPPVNGDLVNSKPDESAIAVIAKRQTLRKNQTQKRTLTQMQVIIERYKEEKQKRKMKEPRE